MAAQRSMRWIGPVQLAWVVGGGVVILVLLFLGIPTLVSALATIGWAPSQSPSASRESESLR